VRLSPFTAAFCAVTAACSASSPGAVGADASTSDAPLRNDGATGDASAPTGGDSGTEASSCACSAAGSCDTFGCPPDYGGPSFAAWCQSAQTVAAGHVIAMRTCGSLLMMTYGTDGGCERGYVVDQPGGALVATLDECNGAVFTCGSLQPSACVAGCCLDKSCTLGVSSLCPPWSPDAGGADAGND
jgi:hypothetical protein